MRRWEWSHAHVPARVNWTLLFASAVYFVGLVVLLLAAWRIFS